MDAEGKVFAQYTGPEILRVGSQTNVGKLAGAIAGILRKDDQLELQAVGAPAVNQAVKALAVARTYLTDEGIDLEVAPRFQDLVLNYEERTAIVFEVSYRARTRA